MFGPSTSRNQRGATAVEFAFIFPILIALVLGFVECGNLFYSWLTTCKAAEAGARLASTGQGEEEGTRMTLIRDEVGRVMARLNGENDVTISSWAPGVYAGEGAQGDAGEPCGMVEVTVAYAYHPVTPILDGVLPETITLSGSDRKVNEPWYRCE